MTPPKTSEFSPAQPASFAPAPVSASADALALVDIGPLKTAEWMERAAPMCKHCQPNEDVDQAAARILAAEVRRLRAAMVATINENLHLADGENCTLIVLKRALAEMPNSIGSPAAKDQS